MIISATVLPPRLGGPLFLHLVAHDIHQVSYAGELLADAIMQVVAHAAMLAIADFKEFTFQPAAFGNVAGDALNLSRFGVLVDEPAADFQFYPLAGGVDKVPFRRRQFHPADHLIEPLLRRRSLIFRDKVQQLQTEEVRTAALQEHLPRPVDRSETGGQVMGENDVVGVFEEVEITLL